MPAAPGSIAAGPGNGYAGTLSAFLQQFDNGSNLASLAGSWGVALNPNGVGYSWAIVNGLNPNGTSFAVVPEPSTCVLLGAGVAGLLIYRGRKARLKSLVASTARKTLIDGIARAIPWCGRRSTTGRCSMLSDTVKEWMAKAEGDFSVACREMRARKKQWPLPSGSARTCWRCWNPGMRRRVGYGCGPRPLRAKNCCRICHLNFVTSSLHVFVVMFKIRAGGVSGLPKRIRV